MKLEICVDSYESLQNAIANGADRIELCSALSLGGLSPTPGTLLLASQLCAEHAHTRKTQEKISPKSVRESTAEMSGEVKRAEPAEENEAEPEGAKGENSGIIPHVASEDKSAREVPIFVMIRPRAGDFLYTDAEFDVMMKEIDTVKKLGFPGIVVGILSDDGTIDIGRMAKIVEAARPMSITFHRAFDNGADPLTMMEDLIRLGVDRVLTSGQACTAMEGAAVIRRLQEIYGEQIIIMPGAGITSDNLESLIELTGCKEYHMSAKKLSPSDMKFRKECLPIPHEPIWRNDKEEIAKARAILYKKPKFDPEFFPIVRFLTQYRKLLRGSDTTKFTFSILRGGIKTRTVELDILCHPVDSCTHISTSPKKMTMQYVERMIKTYLWIVGGDGISVDGPEYLSEYIRQEYRKEGARSFDIDFFSEVFGRAFTVDDAEKTESANPIHANPTKATDEKSGAEDLHYLGQNETNSAESKTDSPEQPHKSSQKNPNLRIGIDLGGSTLKLTMLEDRRIIHQSDCSWTPKTEKHPDYHFHAIRDAVRLALSDTKKTMKDIAFIGYSSAGVVVDNQVIASSLFRSIPPNLKEDYLQIFERVSREFGGIPYQVVNDGEISALAGKLTIKNESGILGLTLGTSLGCGYLDTKGKLTEHINELAFVPLDLSPAAIIDEWSKDRGVGVSYLSQDAVLKLASRAGIRPCGETPSEQFRYLASLVNPNKTDIHSEFVNRKKEVSEPNWLITNPKRNESKNLSESKNFREEKTLSNRGDSIDDNDILTGTVEDIFKDIGIYLAYAVAFYRELLEFRYIVLLGGVITGAHGRLILEQAEKVLLKEFPDIYSSIEFILANHNSHLQDFVAATLSQEEK